MGNLEVTQPPPVPVPAWNLYPHSWVWVLWCAGMGPSGLHGYENWHRLAWQVHLLYIYMQKKYKGGWYTFSDCEWSRLHGTKLECMTLKSVGKTKRVPMHYALCVVYCVLCIVYCVLYVVCCVLCVEHCVLSVEGCVLCSVCYALYVVHCVVRGVLYCILCHWYELWHITKLECMTLKSVGKTKVIPWPYRATKST